MPKLTNDGVNSINESTLFDESIIAPKILGYETAIFTAFEAGFAKPVMRVHYYNQDAMLIIPTPQRGNDTPTVKSIHITSDLVQLPWKISFNSKLNQKEFTTCQNAKDQKSTTCQKENYPNITFVFNDNKLTEIIWSKNG